MVDSRYECYKMVLVFFELLSKNTIIAPLKQTHRQLFTGAIIGEEMQAKLGLVALGVMASLVLFSGNTAEAKSHHTHKKSPSKVMVTVKSGDTLSAIAKNHKTSYVRLFNANAKIDSPDLIYVGEKVRIPSKHEKLPNRFEKLTEQLQQQMIAADAYAEQPQTAATPQPQTAAAPVARGSSAGNTYAYGWCTWYAKERRPDLPNNLGNGGQWVANAAAQGIPTGSTPRVGAIAEEPGHVAYVESVNGSMITISEMGWNYTQGEYNTRTVPAANYRYIY